MASSRRKVWGHGPFRPAWPLGWGEAALLGAALAVVSLGIAFDLAERVFSVAEHRGIDRWELDEVLLALPLVTLALALILRRRARAVRLQDARFRALVEHTSDIIAMCDANGTLRYVSPALSRELDEDPAAWTGRNARDLIHPDDVCRLGAAFAALGRVPGAQRTFDVRLRHQGGTWCQFEIVGTNRLDDPAVAGIVANARDVTDRRAAERDYRELFELAGDAILILDPANETILDANTRACTLYGFPRREFLGRSLRTLSADPDGTHEYLEALLRDGTCPPFETVQYRADGTPLALAVLATRIVFRDRPAVLSINRDITAQKALAAELTHRTLHDSLTGLPNRVLFADRLAHALDRARKQDEVAVMVLDLDRFSLVNDGLGHAAGDQLLIAAGRRIEACLRETDTLARLGSDQFAALLEGTTAETATAVAERIVNVLATPVTVGGRELYSGVSIGLALSGPGRSIPDDLLRRANTALVKAKRAGRAQVHRFDPSEAEDPIADWLALEADLRQALDRNELVLHYQPVVALADGRLIGCEALARWQHPTRGLLPPATFVPLAEENGLITAITTWALGAACRQLAAWRRELGPLAPPQVNVNLTSRDLRTPDLIDRVLASLAAAGLSPGCLRLEITEQILVEELRAAADTLHTLRALGVALAIDDFGAGASSLASLRAIDVEVLKLDRAFVWEIATDAEAQTVVTAIAAMAHALGLQVTAEGIETPAQLAAVRAAGCDRVQGYLITRPLPPEDLASWLAAGMAMPWLEPST